MSKAIPVNSTRVPVGGVEIGQDKISRVPRRRTMSTSEQTATMLLETPPAVPEKDHLRGMIVDGKEYKPLDIQRLEEENETLRQQLSLARGEKAKVINEVNAFAMENHRLKRDLELPSQGSYSQRDLQYKYAHLQADYNSVLSELRSVQKHRAQLHRSEDTSRQNLESLIVENDRLREINEDNKGYIEELLNTTLKDGRWNPIPDNVIRDRLDRLHSDTRDWAKKWAFEPFTLNHLASKPDLVVAVRKLFSNFVRCEADGALPAAVESPNPKMKNKMGSLLLTAALAHRLEVQFFTNPFFCVQPQHVQVMREVYSDLDRANFQQAHAWRSTVWRIMNPPQTVNMSDRDRAVSQNTSQRVRSLCDDIVTDFIQSPACLIMTKVGDAEKNERAKSLHEILLKAAEVATLLWTQRSYVSCININDMIQQHTVFGVSKPTMVAHPMHRIGEDDVNHNGREILIVTRPTILAFDDDDENGLEGDRFRILARAIVWLDEPKKSGIFR